MGTVGRDGCGRVGGVRRGLGVGRPLGEGGGGGGGGGRVGGGGGGGGWGAAGGGWGRGVGRRAGGPATLRSRPRWRMPCFNPRFVIRSKSRRRSRSTWCNGCPSGW